MIDLSIIAIIQIESTIAPVWTFQPRIIITVHHQLGFAEHTLVMIVQQTGKKRQGLPQSFEGGPGYCGKVYCKIMLFMLNSLLIGAHEVTFSGRTLEIQLDSMKKAPKKRA
jgi:hypothetical protein